MAASPRNHRDRHFRHGDVGPCVFAPVSGPFEDHAEVDVEHGVHLGPFLPGGEHDALDQAANGGLRHVVVLRMVQRLGDPRHLAPVDVRDVGMDVRKVSGRGGEPLVQYVLARCEFAQPVHHSPDIAAVLHDRDHGGDLLLDLGQLLPVARARGAALAVDPIGLLGPGPHCLRAGLRCHQPVLQTGQHPLLDDRAADATLVRSGSGHDMVGAAVAVLAAHGIGAAADAAFEQAREQVARLVGAVQPIGARPLRGLDDGGVLLRDLALAVLDRLPEFVVDDAEAQEPPRRPIPREDRSAKPACRSPGS